MCITHFDELEGSVRHSKILPCSATTDFADEELDVDFEMMQNTFESKEKKRQDYATF